MGHPLVWENWRKGKCKNKCKYKCKSKCKMQKQMQLQILRLPPVAQGDGFERGSEGVVLALFAIEHVAHGFAAGGVQFGVAAGEGAFGGVVLFGLAADGAAVGKAGLVGLQLKFISTNGAGSDREWHGRSILSPEAAREKRLDGETDRTVFMAWENFSPTCLIFRGDLVQNTGHWERPIRREETMSEIHNGQCGLCTHFGEGHTPTENLVMIRTSHKAPENLVENCGHPKLVGLHLLVTPISGCTGFQAAA
jgi:hypothetical protein